LNFALPASTTQDVLNRLPGSSGSIAKALAGGASAMLIGVGTNDRNPTPGLTALQSITNLQYIYQQVVASGMLCIMYCESPRGDTTYTSERLSGAQLAYHMQVATYLRTLSAPAVYTANSWPELALYNSTTGDCIPGYTVDGLNWSPTGAALVAQDVAPIIAQLFPPVDILPATNTDQYSSNNPNGCMLVNPMVDSTSGTLASPWTLTNTGGASLSTSKFTDSAGVWQRTVISGSVTGSAPSVIYSQTASPTSLATTDSIASVVRMRVYGASTANTNIQAVQLALQVTASSGTTTFYDGYQPNTAATFPLQDFTEMVLATEPVAVPTGFTSVTFTIQVLMKASSSVALTFDFRQASVFKVYAPPPAPPP
jgi:hypothetical protein